MGESRSRRHLRRTLGAALDQNNIDFLSSRVTNYQYNPYLGVLLDQLRIRPKR